MPYNICCCVAKCCSCIHLNIWEVRSINSYRVIEVNLRDGNTNTDIVSTITISGGTNISLGVVGDTIAINAPNFSDVEVYTTTALRNAATDIVWHHGDLAVAGGATWVYIGTDQTTAGVTIDDDWEELVTPSTQLDAMVFSINWIWMMVLLVVSMIV